MKRNICILKKVAKARNSTPPRGAFLYVVENFQKSLNFCLDIYCNSSLRMSKKLKMKKTEKS